MKENILTTVWQRLTKPHSAIQEPERRIQARLIASIVLLLLPLGVLTTIVMAISDPKRSPLHNPQLRVVLFCAVGILLVYFLGRSKGYLLSVFLILLLGLVTIYMAGYSDNSPEAHFPLYYLSILILISGFLLPLRYTALFAIITLAPMPFFPLLVPAVPLRDVIIGPFNFVALVIATTLLVSHHRNKLEQHRQQQLTHLLDESTYRAKQLTALHETSLDIISHREINELLFAIVTRAAKLLNTAGGSIYLVDPDGDTMTLTAVYGLGEELQGTQIRRGEGIGGRIMLTGQSQIIANYDEWTGRSSTIPLNLLSSVIQVPILSAGKVIGVLSCQEAAGTHRAFNQADIELLEGLARQSALALQNATLFKEEQAARDQAERLQAATQALSSSLELQEVFETILTELRRVVPYDSASVQEFVTSDHLKIIGGYGFPNLETILGSKFSLESDDYPNRHVIESRAPVLLDNAPARFSGFNRDPFNKTIIHSWLGVPMFFGSQIKGMLALDKQEIGFYTQEHARLASAFAAQAAVAIENARLYEEVRQRAFELETLAQISASLRTVKSVPEMMPILLQKTVEAVKADYSVLYLVDQETDELVTQLSFPPNTYCAGLRQPPGDGITGHVAATRKIHVSEDITHDPLLSLLPGEQDYFQDTKSAISAPLQTPERVVGVMHVGTIKKRTFTQADISLVTSISNIAANALNRAAVMDTLEERVADRTKELARANARLKELDTLKTKFISDISHELRTPVATLNLYMDLLERGKPEKKAKYMEILRQKTDVLVRLTEDILSVSRLNLYDGGLKFTAVNLNETVSVVIAMHQDRAQAAGITLTFAPAPNLLPVRAERNQIMQAINNVISNALNYTPAGAVTVRTFPLPDSHQSCLEITDTGIGIAPEEIPHIFERFYRGQQTAQLNIPGTGLGLAIVKEIVDLHKGSIEVESKQGVGSTFRIQLPLADLKVKAKE